MRRLIAGLLLLSACQPAQPQSVTPPASQPGNGVQSPAQPASASPGANQGSGQTGTQTGTQSPTPPSASPGGQTGGQTSGQTGGSVLSRIARISLQAQNPYLDAAGASTRLQASFLDADGKPVDTTGLALVWQSSRPGDIRVDQNGLVTALVEDGYSTITLSLDGLSVQGQQLISVSSGSGSTGGGGGGGKTGPTSERVEGSASFEFVPRG